MTWAGGDRHPTPGPPPERGADLPRGPMKWEAPEPRAGYDWPDVARALREHPGEWLKVFDEGPTSVANAIRQAEVTALRPVHRPGSPDAGFEVRTRNNKPGPPRVCSLYLRWVDEIQPEE